LKHAAVTLATDHGLSLSTQQLAMGTPSTITAATTNAVTTTTHSHAITGFSETSHNHNLSGLTSHNHSDLDNIGANDHHDAVTVSAPIVLTGQAIELKNNAGSPAQVTAIDVGTLANSDTVVPTSKAVKTAIAEFIGLFEIDINGDLEPVTDSVTDQYYELDGSDDIMPKAA
jgi:hypothetical protein